MAKSKPNKKATETPPPLEIPEPKFNWMNQSRQWGTRVSPGKSGLTLDSLNVGVYGEVPPRWTDQGRNPRGAIPVKGALPIGYSVTEKVGLWAPMAAELYEEAIQRRWAPATDVPWASIQALPDDVETAICQVCTEIAQYANVDIEVLTSWQHRMSYGYHEVKQFLATASLDAARRYEAFRKRALTNGGGLGLEPMDQVNRFLLESRGGWTETVAGIALVRGLFLSTMCEYLFRHSYNDAERALYSYVIQDVSRLIAYGVDHLRYCMARDDEKTSTIATMIAIGLGLMARDLRDPVLREALAIVFGGGIAGARREGMSVFFDFIEDFRERHVAMRRWLNLPGDAMSMPRTFRPREPREAR